METPHRAWAFLLTLVAIAALAIPIYYTANVAREFGPLGTLLAWTSVSVAIFAILTVLVSVVRGFVPTFRGTVKPPRNGSL